MTQCPLCRIEYIANTMFCEECGAYLLEEEERGTDPIEITELSWQGEADASQLGDTDLPDAGPLTIRLRIGRGDQARELEVSLLKPVRLGRNDPTESVFPEIDLSSDLDKEYTVSREHACIFQRGSAVMVEDLGSTNGTLLNGERLAPYLPTHLKDGDQLQLGKLLIEVSLASRAS